MRYDKTDHEIKALEEINDLNVELDNKINQGFGYRVLEPIYNKISQLRSSISSEIVATPTNERYYLVQE